MIAAGDYALIWACDLFIHRLHRFDGCSIHRDGRSSFSRLALRGLNLMTFRLAVPAGVGDLKMRRVCTELIPPRKSRIPAATYGKQN